MRFNKKRKYNYNTNGGKGDRYQNAKSQLSVTQVEFSGGTPIKEDVSVQSEYYNFKAFKNLQNVGSIEVKADPNSSVSLGGYPYNVLNKTNRVLDAKYAGTNNIDGNILTRLQNSNNSKLLNCYDLVTINLRLNYLYLCYKLDNTTNHNNLAVNVEMTKAIQEAMSKGYSTMFTQLPFYTDVISTNLPSIGSNQGVDDAAYQKLGALIHYQTILQNAVAPISKYIQTISLEKHAQMVSYRRESNLVTALFGLLKKKAFVATLNAIGTSIIGEYFDLDWYKQMNTLANIPSRKANDIIDPLMTATRTTYVPELSMRVSSTAQPYYSYTRDMVYPGIWLNPDTFTMDGSEEDLVTLNYEELVYRLNRMLDITTMLTWARRFNASPTSVGSITSPSAYYQNIIRYVEAINILLAKFTSSMNEIRTFIDKLAASNMVYWKKGMKFEIENIYNKAEPTYNVILHNMISAYLGGSNKMTYDTLTQRWQVYTLWNKYTGIPEFDKNSGGAFLTFGLRNLDTTGLNNTDIAMCLPIMFAPELTTGSSKCVITTRGGRIDTITSTTTTSTNPSFSRLDPLNVGFTFKVPTINLGTIANTDERNNQVSAALNLLANIFGYGNVIAGDINVNTIDSDYICFLDVQIEDVSNEMIQFCRNYSPFRVMTPSGERTMGFAK